MLKDTGLIIVFVLMGASVATILNCSKDTPAIYIVSEQGKSVTGYELTSHAGHTQEGVTTSVFKFDNTQGDVITITLKIKKAVPPEFVDGFFRMDLKKDTYKGRVTPKNFRYLGGQGDGVSIGGEFLFSTSEKDYQLHLPLTQMQTYGY